MDSVVVGVCHKHVARGGVHGNASWITKLAVAEPKSPICYEVPVVPLNTCMRWLPCLPHTRCLLRGSLQRLLDHQTGRRRSLWSQTLL